VVPDSIPDLVLPHRQSLAENTAQVLLAQLDSGRWQDFLPGERDLCEEFQISRPTLRQALRVLEREGRVEVTQGRRRRIVGRQGGTIPLARLKIIGLLSPFTLKAMPPFVLFWIDELRSHLAKVGYRLEFHASRALSAHSPERSLGRVVYGAPASLWIVLLSTPTVQQWFLRRKLPCLVAGSCASDIPLPSVDIDYRATCRHAAGVFRRAGHTRLALVVPASDTVGDAESEAGFYEGAASDASAPCVLRHDGTREGIMHSMEGALRLSSPPTGFLVCRSAHALTVLTLLLRHGLRLPSEAAVISRDDDAFLGFVTPQIARYRTDPANFARQLSHIVLQMARCGPAPNRPVRLMPKFQRGQTV
jgi:DNA-binding LacI/PurR family transcriptional regulator